MVDLRKKLDIIQRHLAGDTSRQAARDIGLNRKTVDKYVRAFLTSPREHFDALNLNNSTGGNRCGSRRLHAPAAAAPRTAPPGRRPFLRNLGSRVAETIHARSTYMRRRARTVPEVPLPLRREGSSTPSGDARLHTAPAPDRVQRSGYQRAQHEARLRLQAQQDREPQTQSGSKPIKYPLRSSPFSDRSTSQYTIAPMIDSHAATIRPAKRPLHQCSELDRASSAYGSTLHAPQS